MRHLEVMAPVGSYESLQAAIQAGADAVYFGVGSLNMRSRSAANFDLEDLAKIATIAHRHDLRTYLTVNTIIYNEELDEMHQLVQAAKAAGITAIIASDLAVIMYAHSIGVEVHISTQCNVSNKEAVRFYSQWADVVVLARELNLQQVHEISQFIERENIRGPKGELIQIEMFCHGALCMSISGKCYLSLDNAGPKFSANRGSCIQLCRRQYLVKDLESDLELRIDNKYIMSPKDLNTIGFVDKMVKAGVSVFKIEGRGRSADYVKTVVGCYKEALNAIEKGTYTPECINEWNKRLATVFNRGFWGGYYLGRTMGEWSNRYGSQATENKVYLGKVTNVFNKINVAEVKLETANDLHLGDRYMVIGSTTGVYEDVLTEARVSTRNAQGKEEMVDADYLKQGDLFSFPTKEPLHRGDKFYKVVTVLDEF